MRFTTPHLAKRGETGSMKEVFEEIAQETAPVDENDNRRIWRNIYR